MTSGAGQRITGLIGVNLSFFDGKSMNMRSECEQVVLLLAVDHVCCVCWHSQRMSSKATFGIEIHPQIHLEHAH